MSDTIRCNCTHCGAKYRMPLEHQGRTARCKKCGEKFEIPTEKKLEDTVLDWLSESEGAETEEAVAQPRVINMPRSETAAAGVAKGPIRLKASQAGAHPEHH